MRHSLRRCFVPLPSKCRSKEVRCGVRRKSCTESMAWRAVSAAETSLLSDLVALGRIHLNAIGDDWPTKISRSIIRPSTFQVVVRGCASEAENTVNLGHLARYSGTALPKSPSLGRFFHIFLFRVSDTPQSTAEMGRDLSRNRNGSRKNKRRPGQVSCT